MLLCGTWVLCAVGPAQFHMCFDILQYHLQVYVRPHNLFPIGESRLGERLDKWKNVPLINCLTSAWWLSIASWRAPTAVCATYALDVTIGVITNWLLVSMNTDWKHKTPLQIWHVNLKKSYSQHQQTKSTITMSSCRNERIFHQIDPLIRYIQYAIAYHVLLIYCFYLVEGYNPQSVSSMKFNYELRSSWLKWWG